jgi:dUTPase
MALISEKQAYLMGWSFYQVDSSLYFSVNNSKTVDNAIKSEKNLLQFYKFCDPNILTSKKRKLDFLRGIYDRHGISTINNIDNTKDVITFLDSSINIPEYILTSIDSVMCSDKPYTWKGINAIEFLSDIYYQGITLYDTSKYNYYLQLSNPYYTEFYKIFKNNFSNMKYPTFKWAKTDTQAIAPQKNRFSDTGYDLHILKKIKEKNGVHFYDTGIKVEPENGFYFDLVGRSSISKTGWMLANNVGIIDASYRGSIIAALKPVSDNPDDLQSQLPMKLLQLIPRPLILMTPVHDEDMNDTVRSKGGFGSSNKK